MCLPLFYFDLLCYCYALTLNGEDLKLESEHNHWGCNVVFIDFLTVTKEVLGHFFVLSDVCSVVWPCFLS